MSTRAWVSPVGAFVFLFLVLDKFAKPRNDIDRLFFVHYVASAVYAMALGFVAIPALVVRYYGGAAAMEQECELVVFCSVLWVVYFFAARFYEDNLPQKKEEYSHYGVLLAHAAFDSYAGLHLGWDTSFHQVATALSVLVCISYAYQCVFWTTHSKSHSPVVLRSLRIVECILLCAPFVSDIRNFYVDEMDPPHVHTLAYAFAVAAYWQYSSFMSHLAQEGQMTAFSFVRPMQGSIQQMPMHLIMPFIYSGGSAIADGSAEAAPAPTPAPATPEPLGEPDEAEAEANLRVQIPNLVAHRARVRAAGREGVIAAAAAADVDDE